MPVTTVKIMAGKPILRFYSSSGISWVGISRRITSP